jgi:hypothetical protein
MLCLLICFILNYSSLPLTHQHLTHSMLLVDAGMSFIRSAPCGKRHVGPMCTHKLLWYILDTQLGRAELQRCCSATGFKFTIWPRWRALRTALSSHCLFPAAAMRLHLPSLSEFLCPHLSFLLFFSFSHNWQF